MSKKHVFLQFFSKIALFACVFCAFFISPVFATLSAGYTELEYIESTGTQYIDTGIFGTQNTRVKTKFTQRANAGDSSTKVYLGDRWTGNRLFNLSIVPTTRAYMIMGQRQIITDSYWKSGVTFDVYMDSDVGQIVNGVTTAWTGTKNDFTTDTTLKLFGIEEASRKSIVKSYFVKIWDGDTLIRDYIPAKRNSDNMIGMYDLVSGQFFTNIGTGDFIAGPVANCKTFGTDGVTCTECETDYILNNDGGCSGQIKIATTKYVDDEFAPLDTALANAISVVDNVVTQTIAQAGQIATLQNTKQTRPSDDNECPAGKKCLLVTDESGTPHWYEIVEPKLVSDGYTQLEYIESTGTQYIDTGIMPNQNTKIDVDVLIKDKTNGGGSIFGAYETGFTSGIGFYAGYTVGDVTYSNYYDDANINRLLSTDVRYNIVADKNKLYIDDALIYTHAGTSTGQVQANLRIMSIYVPSTTSSSRLRFMKGQCYSAKIYDNNVLVRNLIPAKRNSDNVVGMYDTVSGTFFENAGTGDFIGSAPVF